MTWFRTALSAGRFPDASFTLTGAITVVEPQVFYDGLIADIEAGPDGIRAAVLDDDLRAVQAVCGPLRIDLRPPSSRRGYGDGWPALREAHAKANPWCAVCLAEGAEVPLWEVDHIRPFLSLSDPLRLDAGNLQSLCRPHHAAKSAEATRAGQAPIWKQPREDAA